MFIGKGFLNQNYICFTPANFMIWSFESSMHTSIRQIGMKRNLSSN